MSGPDLEVTNLTVRFGGLVAVDDLSLVARAGVITGLIGPNGAGKTTTFNATTGTVRYQSGSIRLGGQSLDGASVAARAQGGLGRTFQRMELFDTMTVLDNVALGRELLLAGRSARTHLVATRSERVEVRRRAEDALARCGIEDLAERATGDLSTGQRRLVELARVIAGGFRILLLDEPSSGLDVAESEHFAAVIAGVVNTDGIGVLIVEHDMALVRALCTYIYVLDFGRLIYEGDAADVLASDVVKAAYLGSDAVEVA